MKRAIIAAASVCIIEVLMRILYAGIGIDPILYTMITRIIQACLILIISYNDCCIKTKSYKREVLIGIGLSAVFGVLVLTGDAFSRLFISDGILLRILQKQHVNNTVLFVFTACIIGPFVEELFFRGLVQNLARRYMSAVFAIIISTLFFSSMHGNISPVQLAGGLMFGMVFEWRRNIWAAYVFHIAANLGIWLYPYIIPELITRI